MEVFFLWLQNIIVKSIGIKYFRKTKVIGHDAKGRAVRKTFYGNGEKDADRQIDEYMNKVKNGLVTNFESFTIAELMRVWLFQFLHNSSKIKPSTFQRYEGIYRNYIKPSKIVGQKVHSFNNVQLQTFYNDLYKDNYSYSQLKTCNTVLSVFFNWCIEGRIYFKKSLP